MEVGNRSLAFKTRLLLNHLQMNHVSKSGLHYTRLTPARDHFGRGQKHRGICTN
jgi:hypothetical protein